MKRRWDKLAPGSLPSIVVLAMVFHANACKELKARWESVVVTKYLDSSALSAKLSRGYPGVGTRLPIDGGSTTRKILASPFKGLYVIQKPPHNADSLLDCHIGVESTEYAHVIKGGIFARISMLDILDAKRKPLTWSDVRVFMGLGIKLRTPKSIGELKALLEKDSIRIGAEYPVQRKIQADQWFGVFYKETTLKAFIYGIKFELRNDTLRYSYHEPYFSFARNDLTNDWLDGASAVYIRDTAVFNNEKRLEEFIGESYEKQD